jgi:hypothetical protein
LQALQGEHSKRDPEVLLSGYEVREDGRPMKVLAEIATVLMGIAAMVLLLALGSMS